MNTPRLKRAALLLAIACLLCTAVPPATAQTANDEIEVLRGVLKSDHKVLVAECMQLSETESPAFWPLYRRYRLDMDRIGDGLVKLVLEYADSYPDIPEARAGQMLKDYLALENDRVKLRTRHLKKLAKVLPQSKVLRFAQLENRLDLSLRLQVAGALPLAPTTSK